MRKRLTFVGVAIAVLLAQGSALAFPLPALEFWFTDASGSIVPNHGSLGAAGNGTLTGSATLGTVGKTFQVGGYLEIASGGKMSTADIDSLDTLNAFTLSFFVKPTAALANWLDMIGDCDTLGYGSTTRGWNVMTMANGVTRVRLWNGAGSAVGDTDSPAGQIVPYEWQQIAVVATGLVDAGSHPVTLTFYRNGMQVSTVTKTASTIVANDPEGFKIGNAMWDGELIAQYGCVAFFDRALTAQEVLDYYGYCQPEPGTMMLLAAGLGGLALRRRRRA